MCSCSTFQFSQKSAKTTVLIFFSLGAATVSFFQISLTTSGTVEQQFDDVQCIMKTHKHMHKQMGEETGMWDKTLVLEVNFPLQIHSYRESLLQLSSVQGTGEQRLSGPKYINIDFFLLNYMWVTVLTDLHILQND